MFYTKNVHICCTAIACKKPRNKNLFGTKNVYCYNGIIWAKEFSKRLYTLKLFSKGRRQNGGVLTIAYQLYLPSNYRYTIIQFIPIFNSIKYICYLSKYLNFRFIQTYDKNTILGEGFLPSPIIVPTIIRKYLVPTIQYRILSISDSNYKKNDNWLKVFVNTYLYKIFSI